MVNPNHDGWDWPYILYVGRVWLEYSEEEVWALTPRQFAAQLAVHKEIMEQMHGTNSNAGKAKPTGYIDQIPGW